MIFLKTITVDGNEACSYTSYLFTELAGIYPITPSSPMAEHIDAWSKSKTNFFDNPVKIVEMQSEAGASGFVHGSLQAGCLTSTYTSSQGLLLMIPNMYKMAGEMLPAVIHVAARSLSTHALSIMGDHQDIYATRQTGFAILASSSVQDCALLSAVAHLSAIKSSLPFIHFFDGFRTSHEINKIKVLEKNDYKNIFPYKQLEKFRARALNPNKPYTIGTAQGDDIYFQATEVRNKFYDNLPDIVNSYMKKINEKAKTNYKPFNYYGHKNANNVIVAMGSVCSTIKETIDYLIGKGYKVGLLEVHLYRPFSSEYFKEELPKSVKRIAVLDRTKEFGSSGEPLYLDVCKVLKDTKIKIVGGRYGLSSKDTNPNHIIAVYNMLYNDLIDNFTIGIKDDVTNLSLEEITDINISENEEMKIYGYGSDGMISASKGLIKLIGDNTSKYVQGYFQYDSKKSGGMTISHLRFSNKEIRSTYYVNNPSIVVVSMDSYLNIINPLKDIKANGIFILNTTKSSEEVNEFLTAEMKEIIKARKIKFYTINSYEIARKNNLKNKISMIMESVIIKLSNLIDYDLAFEKMQEYIKARYFKNGKDIVNNNIKAFSCALEYINEIEINDVCKSKTNKKVTDIYEAIRLRKGYELKTSDFLNNSNGIYKSGTSLKEKRKIADVVPWWLNNNCIMCNGCSFVCPHSVIKPFLLNEEEYNKAPDSIKNRCLKDPKGYYYYLGISVSDCTGCGLCLKKCPGKKNEKALIGKNLIDVIEEQKNYDYLVKNVSSKDEYPINSIKGSQFRDALFKFHGACSGCGEAPYLKLLTQLFGKNLIISNATGCSSIYGASMPSMPYQIPWASSLFEDNAEYGYGILSANEVIRDNLTNLMKKEDNPLCKKWLKNKDDYNITKEVYENLDYKKMNPEIGKLKEYLIKRNFWIVGGDGWAYDIGFGGIDHVLASNSKVKILVLDTEVYSNTGGQSSKSTPLGSIASFSYDGKKTSKKSLVKYALTLPNVYVGTININSNPTLAIKVLLEANEHDGPAIIIAYSSCIAHGIVGGLEESLTMGNLATKCGYFPLVHYNPTSKQFSLDSKDCNFDLYEEFLNNQSRYNMLKVINKNHASELLKNNKLDAMELYDYYVSLDQKK